MVRTSQALLVCCHQASKYWLLLLLLWISVM
jgi:hypothetical protein